MNSCAHIGRFVADPILTKTPGGIDVCNFIIAVPRPWNSKKTDFIPVVAWRNNAVFINKHFHKGDQIGLTGYLISDVYEKDGVRRIIYKIVADEIHPIWTKRNLSGDIKEKKENNDINESKNNTEEIDSENNSNVINVDSDELSVILGSIPEYDVFANPESVDYAFFDELYDYDGESPV